PGVPVVVLGDTRLDSAIAALRAGAADYLERSAPAVELSAALRRLLEQRQISECLAGRPTPGQQYPELVGESAAMNALRSRVRQAASSDVTILLVGETGTGKELLARLVHASGPRRHGPIVVVNCAAIPDSLADSELFGHIKGSFSGALQSHRGLIRAANEGTLFLDDVGALSLDVQAKLLRSLQERTIRPVGASLEVPVDFRVVASTHADLEALVRSGRFREDLYYRLAVFEVQVPPLRERELDVMLLAERFLEEASVRTGKQIRGIAPAVARAFLSYAWPGNVRELRNCIDYAVAVARYDHLTEADLPDAIRLRPSLPLSVSDDDVRWDTVERRHIEAVLRSVSGNRAHAARLLAIDRKTLHRKLDRMNIDVPPRTRSGLRPRTDAPAEDAPADEVRALASGEAASETVDPQSTRYRLIFR
ncbi:MAG TPA: sigma-54 dependent transcriptional regulator, partial [Polyangiaceae bacterium]|nr:sigma-54 dependent transcriptional regulator [Polyangiaceae bacterium]